MFRPWNCTLQVTPTAATLLVRGNNSDLLKARFEPHCSHPRALLTVLEGLSLWQGKPLRVALSVPDECLAGRSSTLFGDELWPSESQQVQFDIVHHSRPKHLGRVGDFQSIRRPARAAIRYCKNHRDVLFRFIDDPNEPIDNSPTEREFQNVAKLRVNMLFAGSTE